MLNMTVQIPARIMALNARYALGVLLTSRGVLMVGAEMRYLIGFPSLHPTQFACIDAESLGSFSPLSMIGIITA